MLRRTTDRGRATGHVLLRPLGATLRPAVHPGRGHEAGADTAIAVPLTNVFPLVTIVLAYFCFKERLNLIQAACILIAVAAIILLSGEAKNLGDPLSLLRRIGLTPRMLYSLGAMVCWGVLSATQKVSTNHVSAELSFLAWCAAFIPIAVWIGATKPLNWAMSAPMV